MIRNIIIIIFISQLGIFTINKILRTLFKHNKSINYNKKSYTPSSSDYLCIIINSIIVEPLFMYGVLYKTQSHILTPQTVVSPTLILFSILFMAILDDICYTPFHYLLHKIPLLYKHIHYIHHKITHPDQGYIHAVMEHPLEMIIALIIHMQIIKLLLFISSGPSEAIGVWLHIVLKAVLACLNHMGMSVDFNIIWYSALNHHIHHSKLRTNFGQHFNIY